MIKAVIFGMYETLITQYNNPQYFGRHIAKDADIEESVFMKTWEITEYDKTIGKMTFEDAVSKILKENYRYSEELLNKISDKRKSAKRDNFNHLNEQIIPLLKELKKREIKIGIITNCYSEEVEVIRNSCLFKYFDVVCFSYEEGIKKPNEAIYNLCLERLNLNADECLYVGDGGCCELEGAENVGMTAVQAVWYIKNIPSYKEQMNEKYIQAEMPLDILKYRL
ncbi:MAG: HAD family hydrolase [Eubacterium sp.]